MARRCKVRHMVEILAGALVLESLALVWLCSRFMRSFESLQGDLSIQRIAPRSIVPRYDDDLDDAPPPSVNGNSLFEPATRADLRK